MRRLAAIALALFITGCASQAELKIEEGRSAALRGDLVGAEALMVEALKLQPTYAERGRALNNLGTIALRRGDGEEAARAWTLAARMGDPTAVQNLIEHRLDVPAPDLVPQATASSGGAADAALLLFLAGNQSRRCSHRTIGDTGYTSC